MKKILFSLYFTALFALTTLAHASASTDFITLLNAVHSMKANFTQTIYDGKGKATQKSYGRIALLRPGKFRWDVQKPIPQLIIANANKLWIYDPDLEQVTIRTLKKTAGESPALILSHDNTNLEHAFTIQTLQRGTPAWRWFSLTPKQPDNMFESIQMGFVKNQIQEMHLKDNLGHTTVVQFKDIQLNASLPASLFNFKPSAKIDVIDETRK
jgi:outer membrane lipoprotein carrier protein